MTCLQHLHYSGASPFDCEACTAIERAAESEMDLVYQLPIEEISTYLVTTAADRHFWEVVGRLPLDVLIDYHPEARDVDWLTNLAHEIAERRVIAQARREAAA